MIWLASFPRSGNTFTRNILNDVYGLASSEFHLQTEYGVEEDYDTFPVVKTHLLPDQVVPNDPNIPVVYLMRDGRDSTVSMAHHTADIVKPGTDFMQNMIETIIAAEGSHFGGWSVNVLQWIRRADVVIRYEDLVRDPIGQVEKFRKILKMPKGNPENLPTFKKLKASKNPYGVRVSAKTQISGVANKFFRKGKSGAWKEEMPDDMHELFWSQHGEVMDLVGYHRDGTWATEEEFQEKIAFIKKMHLTDKPKKRILIEAGKLVDEHRDGVNRYVFSLCKAMNNLQKQKGKFTHFEIDLLVGGEIFPLQHDLKITAQEVKPSWVENTKSKIRKALPERVYDPLRELYVKSPARKILEKQRMVSRAVLERKNLIESSKVFAEYDLIHVTLPQNYHYFRLMKDHPFVVTIHDMTHKLFPQYHLKANIKNAENGMQFFKNINAHLLAVSDATRHDMIADTGVSKDKTSVVLEAADEERFNHIFDKRILNRVLEKFGLVGEEYFFSLATLEPRKNLKNTLNAFLKLKEKYPDSKIKFVLAGKAGWKEKLNISHPDILAIGYVPDEDLSALLTGATGFCYVSRYEGFGLPLLEAMRCMTPVIYGNNSSMKEIVKDNGLPADPDDLEQIAAQMSLIAFDEKIRNEFSKKGFLRAIELSWEKTASETLEVYERLI